MRIYEKEFSSQDKLRTKTFATRLNTWPSRILSECANPQTISLTGLILITTDFFLTFTDLALVNFFSFQNSCIFCFTRFVALKLIDYRMVFRNKMSFFFFHDLLHPVIAWKYNSLPFHCFRFFWLIVKFPDFSLSRIVTKISSCRVNTKCRRRIKQLGISFGSIFLLFSNKSTWGPHS